MTNLFPSRNLSLGISLNLGTSDSLERKQGQTMTGYTKWTQIQHQQLKYSASLLRRATTVGKISKLPDSGRGALKASLSLTPPLRKSHSSCMQRNGNAGSWMTLELSFNKLLTRRQGSCSTKSLSNVSTNEWHPPPISLSAWANFWFQKFSCTCYGNDHPKGHVRKNLWIRDLLAQ